MAVQDHARAGPSRQVSQADCRAIFDAVSDAILIHDMATGAILDVNFGMCEMFGYTPEEARGLKMMALCGSEAGAQPESVRSLLAQAAAGSPQVFEWQARDRAGRVFWVEVHLKRVRLDGRDRILAVLRDIDRRKQTEEALKESEARYRMVTEGSLAGVYVIQDGGFAYVNPTMAQTFGYQPEEIISRAVEPKDLIHPDDLSLVREKIRRRLSGEVDGAHYTFRGLHKDGTVIYCESFGRAVEYQGPPAIVGTLLDITERKRAEEALLTQTRVLESMAEGVTVTDGDGRIIYSNPAFDTIFGYQPGELIGQPVSALNDFSVSESARFAQEMVEQLKTKGILSGEVRNRKKDGTTFFTQARISALEIAGKTCWILVQEDITERKQMEDIRRRAYEELEGLVAERTASLQAANAQLRREIEERRRTEAIIRLQRDLALTLSAKVGLHEALQSCMETAIAISGLDSGGVYLVDPASGGLDLAYHQDLSPDFVQRVAYYEADSLNAYMVLAGKPVYARLQDLPGILDEGGLKEGLRSAAIIPVIHQDQVIASINIASHQFEEVPATARAALETLAAQVGSAIARVQAEEALRRAKADLEIRVAERTRQLQQANESLEAELQVRRAVEQSLRHSEAKYRTLVEQIPAITYIISLTEGVDLLYVSPQIETLLGFTPEEWRAGETETWKQQIHPDDRERVLAEIIHCIQSGEPFATEYRLLAKSGRVVWFRDEARVVYDQEGEFLFLQGLALDITERKQAEAALRETTHTLQTLIQASPLAIIALDCDLKIRLWNPGAERMFGWQESEVLGGYLPCVPQDQWPEEDIRLRREIAGEVQSALELRRVRRDGSIIHVHLWNAPLLNATGEVIGNMGILADITAPKRAAEALKESEQELRLLTARILSIQEQERRRVARELHDELGQALTVLKIHLVAIEEQLSPAQQHLKANCEQMLSYIDTVIENVRRLSWDLSPSSLEDLGLSSALGYLVDEICRNHNMQSAVVMDEIDHLFSPETQINIYRIFQESLTNVVKHARANLVSVKVKREDGKVSFMIRDNGRGFNLKQAMSGKVAKRSLGLTAMNERALMAAGSLRISSRQGRGTVITFSIPTVKVGP